MVWVWVARGVARGGPKVGKWVWSKRSIAQRAFTFEKVRRRAIKYRRRQITTPTTDESRAGTTVSSSQQQGVHPASIQLAQPSAQKTRRAQGLVSRGRTKSGRERPWCRVHQRHHWCQFTRK